MHYFRFYFSNNHANVGGAVYSTNIVTVRNSLFVNNTADIYAAISSSNEVKFINSIASNNNAQKEGDCPVYGDKNFYNFNSVIREHSDYVGSFLKLLNLDYLFHDKIVS